MPFSLRAGLDDHLCRIHSPSVAEHEESRCQEALGKVIGKGTLLAFCCQIFYEPVVRENGRPFPVTAEHLLLACEFGVAEKRVRVVRVTDIGVEHYHLLDRVDVALREFVPEPVEVGYLEGLDENVYGCEVVMRVEFELSSVVIDLDSDFLVQDIHSALPPFTGFPELREE